MKRTFFLILSFLFMFNFLGAQEKDLIKRFPLEKGGLHLGRLVQPQYYCESIGRQSAILGRENGELEIWIYPYKVLHNFRLYFLKEEENELLDGRDLARSIDVYPHQTILRYVHSSFSAEEILFAPLKESGVLILLSVQTVKPLSMIVSFTPDLKLMWPAGLGGQYSSWDDKRKYFVLSEGTRKNVALVGSPIGERISSGPAHSLPEDDLKFKIYVDPGKTEKYFFPIIVSASHEGRDHAGEIYSRLSKEFEKLYGERFLHYQKLGKEYLSVKTPDEKLNNAYEWAKVALDKAFVCNPHLGCGLVAGYGLSGKSERPGFAWFFGGDTFFNSFALNSFGAFDVTRQSLALIRKNQRKDGKIMHELSQGAGFIPWFEEYPYGFYHAETTPYYIVSLYDYLMWSGDMEFIKESWPALKKAYNYVLSADTDKDGLMENTVAGLAALELGAFLKKTKSDIYLAALSVEAFKSFSEIAKLMGEEKLAQDSSKFFKIALNSLQEKFWVAEKNSYAHALTVDDMTLEEITVWPFMPLFFRQLSPDRAAYVLDLFASSEMSTDWGVRSLSPKSNYYDPINYNYGTVWPFLTGYTCLAEYNYDRSLAAFSHLMSLAHNTFIDALGFCPELFSGELFTPLEESVPHQIFSSSPVITCLVRGLLGLRGNALKREIEFRPSFPGGIGEVEIRNFRIGEDIFHFNVKRGENKIAFQIIPRVHTPYNLYLSPSLGYGSRVTRVKVDDKPKDFNINKTRGEVRCSLFIEVSRETNVEIEYEDGIVVFTPPHFPRTGDITTGLKIINAHYRDDRIYIFVEGLRGRMYDLSIITPRNIVSLSGARIMSKDRRVKKLMLSFEEGENGYTRKEIVVKFE
ncbi:MAG: amylo-alpha-1,6-glucosidase [Candidatus Aminicenantaceae bacterium]